MRKRLKRVLGFSNMPNAPISTQDHLPPSSLFSSVGPTTWTSGSTADTIRGPRATTHFTDDAQLREEGEGIVTTGTGLRALLDLRGGQVGGWGDEGKCILDPRLKPTGVVVGHNRRTDWDEEMRRQLYETDPDPWGVQSKKGGADAEVVPIPPPKPSPFMPLPLIDATDSWLQSAIKAPGTKFDDYKLETEFRDGFMVDTMHKWELSTRLWEKLTWKQLNFIRTGACGGGWLEKESRGKLRAVKKLRRWSTKTTDVSREVLALVKLKDHTNLFLEFVGWYENKDHIFLAMEYLGHGNLREYLKNSQNTKPDVKEITRQILEGLQVLHGKGICHRDLKPENILISSIDPIWVKIANFGVSKRTKNTLPRTRCGTSGYLAPELLGALPKRKAKIRETFTPALDIWSLGCMLHEILTSHIPFFNIDIDDDETGPVGSSQPLIDMESLMAYCKGNTDLPTEALKVSQVSEAAIAFIKSLLIPDPEDRLTAALALQDPWLLESPRDWFEKLRNEFSCLDVDLDPGSNENIPTRQIGKTDIMRFLPSLSKENVPSLLLQAAEEGYNLVIPALLHSPSFGPIDSVTRVKLFLRAVEAGQLDTIKMLLHNELNAGAPIGKQAVLSWAVKKGHLGTAVILLGNTCRAGQTTLQVASRRGYIDVVRLLLGRKADVNSPAAEDGGRTPLQAAAGSGHADVVKLLFENGADVDAPAGKHGRKTTVQAAHESGDNDIAGLLGIRPDPKPTPDQRLRSHRDNDNLRSTNRS